MQNTVIPLCCNGHSGAKEGREHSGERGKIKICRVQRERGGGGERLKCEPCDVEKRR